MSGVALLRAELTNLVLQSKKRNAPMKTASEKSLESLDKISPADLPNESVPDDFLAQLAEVPEFVTPFLLACSSSNAKSCASALQCLQVLASSRGINSTRLHDLLDALLEATQLGTGIQLKILQLLPVLFQSYALELKGSLVSELLQVSAELHGENKVAMVHNAAYATLQQLITGIFDRIGKYDESAPRDLTVQVISHGDTKESSHGAPEDFKVTAYEYDAAKILLDLCEITEKAAPSFLKFSNLPVTFTLEMIELTLTNHASVFHSQKVFGAILRQRITPLLIRLFSETREFALTLRTVRIFYLLLRSHLPIIHVEAEVILSLLGQSSTQPPIWKRVLSLEVLQGVFLEFNLVVEMFTQHVPLRPIIKSIVENFAKNLINNDGALPMSTYMATSKLENDDSSILGSESPTPRSHLLSKQSVVKVPFIDLLDKSEPPRVPSNYLYYLILICINALADGISRSTVKGPATDEFDMNENLSLLLQEVEAPLVNCYTILLGAAMDIDLYKGIVRSVQRTAHVAGVLSLPGIRDDYMNLLVQFGYLPHDLHIRAVLLPRNILCVRALFNLGFALGNSLESSWSVIVECCGNLAMQIKSDHKPNTSNLLGGEDEYNPIEASMHRLLDSTTDLDDSAIYHLLQSLGNANQVKPIYFVMMEIVARVNADRLAVHPSACWNLLLEILLGHIKNKSLNPELRTLAAEVLNDAIFVAMESASSDEAYEAIIGAVATQIDGTGKSSETQDSLDSDIQFGAVQSLNRLLDQFGSRLTAGWEIIFNIISAVFNRTGAEISTSRRLELIKASFHSLELVTTDFLEHLPEKCVFDLTISLDNFARQDADINTAFTAISLFWTVCDHLMRDSPIIDKFPKVSNEDDLIKLSKSDTPVKHHALWMLALMKLASIANEPQHQKKTGAIQIFFRLFESHDKLLPPSVWNVCQELVFPKIMQIEPDTDQGESDETVSLIVNGLGGLYTSHLPILAAQPGFVRSWANFVAYLNKVAKLSVSNALNVYQTFRQVLNTAISTKTVRAKIQVWDFWAKQDPNPKLSEKRPKQTVESLKALVGLYPDLSSFVTPSLQQQKEAILLIYECARYPHAGEIFNRNSISDLQKTCLDLLETFDNSDPGILTMLVEKLSALSLLPFLDNDTPPGLYASMSTRAQSHLLVLLNGLRDSTPPEPELRKELLEQESSEGIVKALVSTLEIVVAILQRGDREIASKLFLALVGLGKDYKVSGLDYYINTGAIAFMEGGDAGSHSLESQIADIDSISELVAMLDECDEFSLNVWNPLIHSLATNSLLYERGLFQRDFFSEQHFPVSLDEPPFYGTIEPPNASARQEVGYHCLSILCRLAFNGQSYSYIAAGYFQRRVKLVLYQFMGDSSLRGKEPMPSLLRSELLFILEQLIEHGADPAIKALLLRCMSLGDRTVSTLIQQILLSY